MIICLDRERYVFPTSGTLATKCDNDARSIVCYVYHVHTARLGFLVTDRLCIRVLYKSRF